MGGEGSMAQANQSLKLNRSQLRGRHFRDNKDLMRSYSGKTTIAFEKIGAEELLKIKQAIRFKARKDKEKRIIAYIITALIMIILIIVAIQYA